MKTLYDSNDNRVDLMEMNDINGGNNYLKFPNGLAIVFGFINAKPNEVEATFNFPFPLYEYTVIATHHWSTVPQGKVTIGVKEDTSCKILIYDFNDDVTKQRNAQVLAIGRWK